MGIGAELSGGARGNGRTLIDGEFGVPDAPDRNLPGLTYRLYAYESLDHKPRLFGIKKRCEGRAT